MLLFRLIKYVLFVHKYPRYLLDYCYMPCLVVLFRLNKEISLGNRIVWQGMPIISVFPGSKLQIGDRCVICSRSDQTALGVNHPVVLRTICAGAELRIGNAVRMSGTTICAAERVVIGDRCVIGANVSIVDTDFHSLDSTMSGRLKAGCILR